jgi:hypothetical protein
MEGASSPWAAYTEAFSSSTSCSGTDGALRRPAAEYRPRRVPGRITIHRPTEDPSEGVGSFAKVRDSL